jgi:hypothetical protein
MDIRNAEDFKSLPHPATLLRQSAFTCLAGAGLCIITYAKTQALWAHEIVGYLVCPLLAFALLFVEYKLVEALIRRELDRRYGYAQVLGCVVISLYGVLALLSATSVGSGTPPGLSERILLLLCVFGEAVFVANVIYTYRLEQHGPPLKAASIPPAPISVKLPNTPRNATSASFKLAVDWQNSPVAIFGIATVFFALMGAVFAKVGFLTSQIPVGWNGSTMQVPAGYLCASTALPFGVFALAYFILEQRFDMEFVLTATRAHFVCTLLAVLEMIHVYMGWASSWASPSALNNPVTAKDFGGAFALGALACGCFVWNIVASSQARS